MFPQWVFAYSAGNFFVWTLVVTHTGRGRKTKGLLHLLADCSCISLALGRGRPGRASDAAWCPSQWHRATNSICCNGMPGVSDTLCLPRPFMKPSLNQKGPKSLKQNDFCVWQFFQVPFKKCQCGKTQKKKLYCCFCCSFVFLTFYTEELTYLPYSMEASLGKKK